MQIAPSTSGHVPRPTKAAKAKKEVTVKPNPSLMKGKPSITRSTAFKPAKSKTIAATTQKEVEYTAAIPKRRGRPPGSSSTVRRTSTDNPYTPPLGQADSSLNESCIAKRVSRHRGAREPPKALTDSRESSSESERSSSDDSSEDSDPPVYRSHSVLSSLELRIEGTKGGSPPKSAPPCIRVQVCPISGTSGPNHWLIDEIITHIFI